MALKIFIPQTGLFAGCYAKERPTFFSASFPGGDRGWFYRPSANLLLAFLTGKYEQIDVIFIQTKMCNGFDMNRWGEGGEWGSGLRCIDFVFPDPEVGPTGGGEVGVG